MSQQPTLAVDADLTLPRTGPYVTDKFFRCSPPATSARCLAFWRSRDSERAAKILLILALASIIAEIVVGGIVVNSNLSPAIVTVHQAIAMLVFGLTVGAAAVVFHSPKSPRKD